MPDTISQDAINLIVTEEDSDKAYYERHYEHFDWPKGASGATIGIGYDCGYCTPQEVTEDWGGIVAQATIEAIKRACGLKGEAAHQFVRANGSGVTITWDQAMREFTTREVPKWIARVCAVLTNADKLSPTSLGALVSLAYNRGTGVFVDAGPRYAEGRAIKAHMAAGNFAAIPHDILSMQRLWPRGSDLWRRRAHEAALFQKGLDAS
jgi:GH24 family phage-related lysozyme (muramidase)